MSETSPERIARSARSLAAWLAFRERVAELGGTVVEPEWLGRGKSHRVICGAGHECRPCPTSVQQGQGLCRVCAGRDSADSERRFREQIAKHGGTIVEPEWLGTGAPHRVICAEGHACSPRPKSVLSGNRICRVCAGRDSAAAWRQFQDRVAELGGVVIEPEWLGVDTPHRMICAAGHERSVRPGNVHSGQGLCLTCTGQDPAIAWRRFQERVAELGGVVVESKWLGANTPHRVVCAAGHERSVRPGSVQQGYGICRICSWSSSSVFYVVENETLGVIKLGITSGDGAARLGDHRRDGFTTVLRVLPELADAAFLEAHTLKTLGVAGVEPVRGREYFARSAALPVVLDIVDNWLTPKAAS